MTVKRLTELCRPNYFDDELGEDERLVGGATGPEARDVEIGALPSEAAHLLPAACRRPAHRGPRSDNTCMGVLCVKEKASVQNRTALKADQPVQDQGPLRHNVPQAAAAAVRLYPAPLV